MNALIDQLTTLRLHGMATCAQDLLASRKPPSLTTALRQLIDAETVERQVRSIQYQMRIAKFPHHKDFATFDYSAAAVRQAQIEPFWFWPVHPGCPQSHSGGRNRNRQNPHRHCLGNHIDQSGIEGALLQRR